jgi:glutamate racemase
MPRDAHIVITDSGLGGLSVCAALDRALRLARAPCPTRLTYVNVWPYEDRGYNDLPDDAARADVFDAALARLSQMAPDRIVIACNTLSILYPLTRFSSRSTAPVDGIVDAGVELFIEGLTEDPGSSVLLLGTKTTIASGEHRARLVRRGVDPSRLAAVPCHGLAGAIERDISGPRTAELLAECAARAATAAQPGETLLLGLCCTHYGYVASRLVDAVATHTARPVRALDPNLRLVAGLLRAIGVADGEAPATRSSSAVPGGATAAVAVTLVSKVHLLEQARAGIARLIEPVSPATASALLSYAHVPDLF